MSSIPVWLALITCAFAIVVVYKRLRSSTQATLLEQRQAIMFLSSDAPTRIRYYVGQGFSVSWWLRTVARNATRKDRTRFTVLEEACLEQQLQIEWLGAELQELQAQCRLLAAAAGVPIQVPGAPDRFCVSESRAPTVLKGCPFDGEDEEEENVKVDNTQAEDQYIAGHA